MTLTRCLAKLCPLMNELKQAYLPNKHNKPAKFFLTFADEYALVSQNKMNRKKNLQSKAQTMSLVSFVPVIVNASFPFPNVMHGL